MHRRKSCTRVPRREAAPNVGQTTTDRKSANACTIPARLSRRISRRVRRKYTSPPKIYRHNVFGVVKRTRQRRDAVRKIVRDIAVLETTLRPLRHTPQRRLELCGAATLALDFVTWHELRNRRTASPRSGASVGLREIDMPDDAIHTKRRYDLFRRRRQASSWQTPAPIVFRKCFVAVPVTSYRCGGTPWSAPSLAHTRQATAR